MDLSQIRQQINHVDAQMKELFLERMAYAVKVAEEKKRTGGSVYVPEREQEVLRLRRQGVEPEFVSGCNAFFRQLMGISRTFQYAKLAGESSLLSNLPDGEGEVCLIFFCGKESGLLADVLNAASLAGLLVTGCTAQPCPQGGLGCELRLAGDFSQELARAAVLQVLKERDQAVLLSEKAI